MNTTDKLQNNIQNLTTSTIINSYNTVTRESFDDTKDMTRILIYAMPLSCVVIIMVLLITIGIHRRHHVLEKWTSLRRMRNTNPRVTERAGLRRDSEYESYNDNFVNVTVINEDAETNKEPDFRLATIT